MSDAPKQVWVFDENRRKYKPAPPGRIWSDEGPIWIEHWVGRPIVGETGRSWTDNQGRKYPKTDTDPAVTSKKGYVFDRQWIEREAWAREHRASIIERIQAMPFEQLTAVAELIEYEPEPPGVSYRLRTANGSQ